MYITREIPSVGNRIWVVGYGNNARPSGGFGVQRLSDEAPAIDWVGSDYHITDVVDGEGRACKGDSGGPNISTSVVPEKDIAIALYSQTNKLTEDDTNQCPPAGFKSRHTMLAPKWSWIHNLAGCTPVVTSGGYDYGYCW
jgi:hypothetical protein